MHAPVFDTVVMKFGGSSVADPDKIRHVASRFVDAFAVTTVTGMVAAAASMLVANRAIPADLAGKGDWEQTVFWTVWLAALAHALWRSSPVAEARSNPAWREQCFAIAVLSLGAVGLNWVTTGDHLLRTLVLEPYMPVAGVDLGLLAAAAASIFAARELRRRERPLRRAASDAGATRAHPADANGGSVAVRPTTAHRTGTSGASAGNVVSRSVRQTTQAGVRQDSASQSKTQTWFVPPPPTGVSTSGPSLDRQTWIATS